MWGWRTFEALVAGVQELWRWGLPAVLRHDNLSAATHELRRSGGRGAVGAGPLCARRGSSRASRTRRRGRVPLPDETAVEQALLLRGDRDFVDEAAYLRVRMVVDEERNAPAAARLAEEWAYLRPLPSARIPEYTTFQCRVRKWSTIRVGGRIYSVPSRLIGHLVEARQHPSTVEVLRRPSVHDAASAWRSGGAPDRLPPHHREPGPQAGCLRAVSLP